MNEEIINLKKISLTLRDMNKEWIKDGDEFKLIEKIIDLDCKIYTKIKKLENALSQQSVEGSK